MDYKKYIELERLVETGGDENRIEELRRELGITTGVRNRPRPQADKFDVGKYKKLKRKNVPDRVIAEEFGMTLPSFKRWKGKLGLTASKEVLTNG